MSTAFDDVKPFPGKASQAGIGHNKPPLDAVIVAEFEEGLRAINGLLPRIDAMVERAKTAGPCTDEDTAGRYGDFCAMARKVAQAVEDERMRHNRPLLDAQKTLKARADGLVAPLLAASNSIRAKLDAFMVEQRRIANEKRLQAEEQARAAQAAAEAKAREQAEAAGVDPADVEVEPIVEVAPAPVDEPVVRGDYGARVGSTTVWLHSIESIRKLPDHILKHEKVVEAIDKVIAAQVRGGAREIRGCKIWSEQRTAVR